MLCLNPDLDDRRLQAHSCLQLIQEFHCLGHVRFLRKREHVRILKSQELE